MIDSEEVITLAVERDLSQNKFKVKGVFRLLGLVSFDTTNQVSKKEVIKYWINFLDPLMLFKMICHLIVNLVLILLNVLSSIFDLVGKTIMITTCSIPIIYWFLQKSDDNKMKISELFNSYGSFFVYFMMILLFIKLLQFQAIAANREIKEFYKNIFLEPLNTLDLICVTIWYKAENGEISAINYAVDKGFFELRFYKEEILNLLLKDKLTLEELRTYFNTLSSVDKFFLIDGFNPELPLFSFLPSSKKKLEEMKRDYNKKLRVKRFAKNVYLKRVGVMRKNKESR